MLSLHERLGGDPFMRVLLSAFYDNLCTTSGLEHFFRQVPVETIKTHHAKFFRMLFSHVDDQPGTNAIIDYLLLTHSQLFRQDGLNELHFDLVAVCIVQTMNELLVDQNLIDECVTILVPFRELFAYGAKVADKEKEMDENQIKSLPSCSAQTMGTNQLTTLPRHHMSDVPCWLLAELKKISNKTVTLRFWTANLSDRFSTYGDLIVADTLMDIPFAKYELYIACFMQLAFPSTKNDATTFDHVLKTVQYPRGPTQTSLPRVLFDRMVIQFEKTCFDLNVQQHDRTTLLDHLNQHRLRFEDTVPEKVNGVRGLHALVQEFRPELNVDQILEHTTAPLVQRDPTIAHDETTSLTPINSNTGITGPLKLRKRRPGIPWLKIFKMKRHAYA
jgi:truncated hemoglobin YjbI